MKRHLQCAEQQVSLSNLTKYCACHEKWHCKISKKISNKQVKRHFQCGADPTMIRPWSENDHRPWYDNANRNSPRNVRLLWRGPQKHFSTCTIQRTCTYFKPHQILRLPLYLTHSNTAPATKSAHLNFTKYCACHLKSDTWTSLEITAPATKSDTWTSLKYCTCLRKVTLELHQVLRLPLYCELTLLDSTLLDTTLLDLTLLYLTLFYLTLLYLTLLYLTTLLDLLYLTTLLDLLYLTLLYLTLFYLTLLYLTLLYLTLLYLTLLYLTTLLDYSTWLYSTWLYSTWHYSTWLYSTWLYSTWLYSTWLTTWLYSTWHYSTWLYSTWHYSTWLYSTWLYSTWHYSTWLYSTWLTLLDSTLLDTILLDSTLLDSTLLDLTLLRCRSYIGSFWAKLPLIIKLKWFNSIFLVWTRPKKSDTHVDQVGAGSGVIENMAQLYPIVGVELKDFFFNVTWLSFCNFKPEGFAIPSLETHPETIALGQQYRNMAGQKTAICRVYRPQKWHKNVTALRRKKNFSQKLSGLGVALNLQVWELLWTCR